MAAPMENTQSHTSSFPIKHKQVTLIEIMLKTSQLDLKPNKHGLVTYIQTAFEINSHHTELVCSQFDDRFFIIVTQFNKIGTLVKVTRDNVIDETGTRVPMISTDVLMGIDEPITHVVAKNLVRHMNIQKQVILSMALKDNSPKTVKAIAEVIPTIL